MRFSLQLILVALLYPLSEITSVVAVCKNPTIRKEWRELTDTEKQDYHTAVKCLKKAPAQHYKNESAVVSRLDDFTYTHQILATQIHEVASFLPWHRYFVQLHENALRNECNYKGPIPYWDWSIDADKNDVPSSPIWDPSHGFGGNGVPQQGSWPCVEDGPYANLSLNLGPVFPNNMKHCLIRIWNDGTQDLNGNWNVGDMSSFGYNSGLVNYIYSRNNFGDFATLLEDGPHGYVHDAIYGDMGPHTSPNEPLFYLHHANVDRIWAKWQGSNASRLHDFSGWKDENQTIRASINDTMPVLEMSQNTIIVRDYMDTQGGPLCYQYTSST